MKLKKNAEVTVDITPEEMATIWWGMNCHEQCIFFNKLYELCHKDGSKKGDFLIQLHYIADSPELNKGGRWIMKQIGNYAEKVEK